MYIWSLVVEANNVPVRMFDGQAMTKRQAANDQLAAFRKFRDAYGGYEKGGVRLLGCELLTVNEIAMRIATEDMFS